LVLSKKILFIAVFFSASVYACGLFVGRGFEDLRSLPVNISEEETLIVWSESQKRQDFIRKVIFNASVPEFGLLVPVPTRPEVAEASDSIFEVLRDEMEKQRPHRREWIFPWTKQNLDDGFGAMGGGMSRGKGGAPVVPGGIQVVEELQVGLFKTQVITATNTKALDEWLQKEGFSLGTESQKYLQHYVGGTWHWVVFSYKGKSPQDSQSHNIQIESQTFRLSFDSERAFYPYREPQHAAPPSQYVRTLRLYVLSEKELEGQVEADSISEWPPMQDHFSYLLFRAALKFNTHQISQKISSFASQKFLSAFHETLYPQNVNHSYARRLDGDLFFKNSEKSKRVLLPEKVSTIDTRPYLALLLLLLAALMGAMALRRMIQFAKKRGQPKP
jgi:hypothetical protein